MEVEQMQSSQAESSSCGSPCHQGFCRWHSEHTDPGYHSLVTSWKRSLLHSPACLCLPQNGQHSAQCSSAGSPVGSGSQLCRISPHVMHKSWPAHML